MSLNLEIIMPSKVVFKDEVDEIIVPTVNGEITILPNHVGLLTQITEGEITTKKSGKEHFLAITGGYLEVNKNKVTILADYAIRSEDIEIAKVQEAQKRAQHLMQEKVSEKDFAEIQSELRKSILQLKVANKRKRHSVTP
ncbi:ATP synthase F1 subunit epsilon [Candidatus Microgenomates bacterium]|nr:MAG: ATP synthase F1 subunit epsilon [Candidatus Microgenomates bacterium]